MEQFSRTEILSFRARFSDRVRNSKAMNVAVVGSRVVKMQKAHLQRYATGQELLVDARGGEDYPGPA